MLFSSLEFLFLFLPVVLLGYYVLVPRLRNVWLLAASLLSDAPYKKTVHRIISSHCLYVARGMDDFSKEFIKSRLKE